MEAIQMIRDAEKYLIPLFNAMGERAFINQSKVLQAFKDNRVRELHFSPSSGYGYSDTGRDLLENIFAQTFDAEAGLVRPQIVSGTHAISACLCSLLKSGDQLISASGPPYDTLANIIKGNQVPGHSLVERGIDYCEIPLISGTEPDLAALSQALSSRTKMVIIQRSRGYTLRPALTVAQIAAIVKTVRAVNPSIIVFVDNCYGEFCDIIEPSSCGAHLVAGSLIKNPGGGLAPSGGYIVGRKDLVEEVSYYLTAPGLGKELGASLGNKRAYYQGFFLAPHTVLQALKGAVLVAYIFEQLGFEVYPRFNEERGDIVQAIKLDNPEMVTQFCQIVQHCSPVDSDVKLEFARLPGYADPVVMAAGTFVQGSSIELSCDAPLRAPFCAFWQGGLTYEHIRLVLHHLIDYFRSGGY
ncbi:MAG: aminotransferase class I/II-fold pyridoxal phosphate-dependent enzyme [Syntrophomonadaceae bacterium]